MKMSTSKLLEETLVFVGSAGVQFVFAFYALLQKYLLVKGVAPLFLVIFGNLATSVFLLPFSICFERKCWPSRFSVKLLSEILFISIFGITLFQTLMVYGVKKTSPALASVTPNLAPGFIFIIASLFRYEKFSIKCIYTQTKILGTIVCLTGAIMLTLLHPSTPIPETNYTVDMELKKNRVVGTLCLIGAVLFLSMSIIMQAETLSNYQAPISLTVITSFIGAILSCIMQLIQQHTVDIRSNLPSEWDLIGFAALAGIAYGASGGTQAWAMGKKGPVFVSTFSPINTVFSVTLASITLGESVTIGSLSGMILMFMGLYSVLWAKKKEDLAYEEKHQPKVPDIERPFLHG